MAETTSMQAMLAERAWLEGVARALVGDGAEDAVQETYLSAMRSPPPKGRPIRPWLIRVLRNAARMQKRSDARRDLRESRAAEPEGQADASQLLARAKAVDALMRNVAELDPALREVLLLRHGEGLSAADIGRLLEVPAGTIRWRHKEALDILRSRLDAESGGERNTWHLALISLGSPAALAKPSSIGVLLTMKAAFTAISAAVLALGGIAAFVLHSSTDTTRAEDTRSQVRPTVASASPEIVERSKKAPSPTKKDPASSRARHAELLERLSEARAKRLAAAQIQEQEHDREAPVLNVVTLEKEYVQKQVKELMPLFKECYEMALERDSKLEGRIVVEFAIVGEAEVGGVIEYGEVDQEESDLLEPGLVECISGTVYGLEFEPPVDGGRVVVRYPLLFRPTED